MSTFVYITELIIISFVLFFVLLFFIAALDLMQSCAEYFRAKANYFKQRSRLLLIKIKELNQRIKKSEK